MPTDDSLGDEIARYECRCGNSLTFQKSEFNNLRWLAGKFNYGNVALAVAAQVDCCDRPSYMETEGWDDAN